MVMSLRLFNRLSHPIPYPGAGFVPCDESTIIEEPDLSSDPLPGRFWDRSFYSSVPPVGRGPHFTGASRGACASRQGSGPFDKRGLSLSRGEEEGTLTLQPLTSPVLTDPLPTIALPHLTFRALSSPPPVFLSGSSEQNPGFDASTVCPGLLCIITPQSSLITDPSPGQFPLWLSGFSRPVTFFLHRYLIGERAHPRHIQGTKSARPHLPLLPATALQAPRLGFRRAQEIQGWRTGLSSAGPGAKAAPRAPS